MLESRSQARKPFVARANKFETLCSTQKLPPSFGPGAGVAVGEALKATDGVGEDSPATVGEGVEVAVGVEVEGKIEVIVVEGAEAADGEGDAEAAGVAVGEVVEAAAGEGVAEAVGVAVGEGVEAAVGERRHRSCGSATTHIVQSVRVRFMCAECSTTGLQVTKTLWQLSV